MTFHHDMFSVQCVLLFRNMVKLIFRRDKGSRMWFRTSKKRIFSLRDHFFHHVIRCTFISKGIFLHEIQKNYPSENALVTFFWNDEIPFFYQCIIALVAKSLWKKKGVSPRSVALISCSEKTSELFWRCDFGPSKHDIFIFFCIKYIIIIYYQRRSGFTFLNKNMMIFLGLKF